MIDKLDKNRIALVVIDLQKGIVSIDTAPYKSQQVLSNAIKLANVFRDQKMPVFLVNVGPSKDLKDSLQPKIDKTTETKNIMPENWMEIVDELAVDPSDIRITKRQWGAFYGTELDLQLRRRNIDTIVLCGISTNIGVESTARFAYEYGYSQYFIEDACSARSEIEHSHTMNYIFPKIGKIRKTEEILKSLEN